MNALELPSVDLRVCESSSSNWRCCPHARNQMASPDPYENAKCGLHGKTAKECDRCRCPKCKRGVMHEWRVGWWCSRLYAKKNPCDYEVGDPGPRPAPMKSDAPTKRRK